MMDLSLHKMSTILRLQSIFLRNNKLLITRNKEEEKEEITRLNLEEETTTITILLKAITILLKAITPLLKVVLTTLLKPEMKEAEVTLTLKITLLKVNTHLNQVMEEDLTILKLHLRTGVTLLLLLLTRLKILNKEEEDMLRLPLTIRVRLAIKMRRINLRV